MPELSASTYDLASKQPAELEQRRREIVTELQTKYHGNYNDPQIPSSLLHELVLITSTLRRSNAGPPKKAKQPAAAKKRATVNDLLSGY